MDCKQARELMWEKDLPAEFFAHIETCSDCRKEYELIKKTKTALSSKDNVKERILVAATLDKRRRTALRITRIAAAFLVVFAVGIFAKLALDTGLKTANDCEANFAPNLEYKAESSTAATVGGILFDGVANDEFYEAEEPMESTESEEDYDVPHAEEPMAEKPVTTEDAKNEILRDDVGMLMNVYKDMHSLSYHTADIIVSGDDVSGVCNALYELGAEEVDSHIEIAGDFYFEAQDLLTRAGFDILYVSSSESINKTLIYFEDLMK